MSAPRAAPELVEDFFRHEYGKLVAVLSRDVGVANLAVVEDAAQSALESALAHWPVGGLPDHPTAWLYRSARNALVGDLRQRAGRRRLLAEKGDWLGPERATGDEGVHLAGEVQDDLLRMLFVCCDDAIPLESQIVLALKTLCGFSVREIAYRLFATEANVYKRLGRARDKLREQSPRLDDLDEARYAASLSAVHEILHALFTEGYLSSHPELAIRRELCSEAIRLATILADHPVGRVPSTFALLALMHLHRARLSARQDETGLLLLGEQDRALWDAAEIHTGLQWLERAADGDAFTRYHAEAGIAAEHALAPSLRETRWDRIVDLYRMLEAVSPSPLHGLNRAVATAEWKGPEAGLQVLDALAPPPWLIRSHHWSAVHADLHARCGNTKEAERHRAAALAAAPTQAVRDLLERRLGREARGGSR